MYSVAGAKALPAWLSEKKARAAKRDPSYAHRIELVQDLGFPGACQRMKLSPDGNFLFASGTHPPRVRFAAKWSETSSLRCCQDIKISPNGNSYSL